MAFNCYRRPPELWQSRTSLPLATPVSRHSQRSPISTGNSACHTHAFFRSHGQCLWRACRKASAVTPSSGVGPGPVGRSQCRPPAWAGQDVRGVGPLLDCANRGGQPRDIRVGDAGEESARHRLVHRAVRPVEERNHRLTWVLAIHARAGSPGAPRTRRPGHSRAAATWGPRRHRRAGNRVWRPREANGRRCHATWHTALTAGTARTPARSSPM